jgi:hypothetical protein
MAKSSERQFLVKVAGLEGLFMTKTGGDITAPTSKVYDGGNLTPEVMAGPAEAANVVISRAFDPLVDGPILTSLRQQVGSYTDTLSVTPTDRDLVALGNPTVYSDALLVGLTEPTFDAASGNPSNYDLEFAIGAFR